MYYVIMILGYLSPPPGPPPPFVITFSTERNQKLPFSDPPLAPFVIAYTWNMDVPLVFMICRL